MNDDQLEKIKTVATSIKFWNLSAGIHLNMVNTLLHMLEELKGDFELLNDAYEEDVKSLKRDVERETLHRELLQRDYHELSRKTDRYRTALEEILHDGEIELISLQDAIDFAREILRKN